MPLRAILIESEVFVMKKLGESTFKGEFKIIKKFLTSLNFELDRTGKHGSIWKNHQKNLITNVTTSSSDWRWYKNWKSDFTKLVSENFTREEIEQLLAKLIKKRKVQYTADGRLRILRISPKLIFAEPEDLEEDLLYALLPPDSDDVYEKVKKIIQEKKKTILKNTEREKKEKLKKLKQRKKEVEEEILNEIKKLAPEKLKNLQFPPDHKI